MTRGRRSRGTSDLISLCERDVTVNLANRFEFMYVTRECGDMIKAYSGEQPTPLLRTFEVWSDHVCLSHRRKLQMEDSAPMLDSHKTLGAATSLLCLSIPHMNRDNPQHPSCDFPVMPPPFVYPYPLNLDHVYGINPPTPHPNFPHHCFQPSVSHVNSKAVPQAHPSSQAIPTPVGTQDRPSQAARDATESAHAQNRAHHSGGRGRLLRKNQRIWMSAWMRKILYLTLQLLGIFTGRIERSRATNCVEE
ncbi:hypothetical protein R1sor_011015 [Riccia sorocarpa]|uniref:Uncharacterized protein n=1 Tax=Riccia sorocarpa TaxID=122646 RepID=A0ABD3I1I5_9MARC